MCWFVLTELQNYRTTELQNYRTPELQKSEAASKNTAVIWYIKNIFIHEQNLISSMTGSWDSVEARTPDLYKKSLTFNLNSNLF